MRPVDGRLRVVIEGVEPEIDAGRFAVKRTVGELLTIKADLFADGHDVVTAVALMRHEDDPSWSELYMQPLGNDRWRTSLPLRRLGRHFYTVEGWIDTFETWRRDLRKRVNAGQDVTVELLVGAELVGAAAERASGEARALLETDAEALADPAQDAGVRAARALEESLAELMARWAERRFVTRYERELPLWVDRERARFSSWYEFFPRSCAPGRHGRFRDAEERLRYAARLGFDVVYLPPIHPIGSAHRKGKNNSPTAEPGDVGSPWAIGAEAGGHDAIHPELGTFEDFRRFVDLSKSLKMEIALDLAFQCSPDHPYVREHPEWFRKRPDGSIRYAENPPKKYQDIYPFDFECEGWTALWEELLRVIRFWVSQGIEIFRVDNPHTKAFPFWEWAIGEVQKENPKVIFLAEAFTRPKVMRRLAKLGFTQSYTYFTWRNTKQELTEYFTELTRTESKEYFRPNLWPNTPDILPEALQTGGRAAFATRFLLGATLGASYGIYGPAFELGVHAPKDPGGEEYGHSEKYELKVWHTDALHSLAELIGRVNRLRREHPALQYDHTLKFHRTDNEKLICYSKTAPDGSDPIIVVVNLDPHHKHTGWVDLDLDRLGIDARSPYQVHDLIGEARFLWQGSKNYVELSPEVMPAHVFAVRRKVRTERDFDYYL
jgi:starch synthase (maltosyl-transferring)